ncbi:Ribosomal protein S18 acetylase RimI [Devosia crocina]|uniref:Ribosomal protein S18 acetylase RimI n=1 Tax=Devosia crocina TaxID=429728 RepID=A0A1I7NBI4_9HYPH|nr:GNAT family N-acetyltransferase [Devosia crocina]SFV32001.1 Ribosomal protein S18 acetylase RimI [Devosia crocina]
MAVIKIRKAEISDAPRMSDIAFSAWDTGIRPLLDERPGQRESERTRLSQAAGMNWQNAIVATINGIVVGWCCRSPRRSYIPYLFVMPDMQGNGIGAQLLSRMEMILEMQGARRVHLETPADNVRAVRFYEKQGYHILALRGEGRRAHEPFMSVHLEKALHPIEGAVD